MEIMNQRLAQDWLDQPSILNGGLGKYQDLSKTLKGQTSPASA
jgi:hypothetical protein